MAGSCIVSLLKIQQVDIELFDVPRCDSVARLVADGVIVRVRSGGALHLRGGRPRLRSTSRCNTQGGNHTSVTTYRIHSKSGEGVRRVSIIKIRNSSPCEAYAIPRDAPKLDPSQEMHGVVRRVPECVDERVALDRGRFPAV